MGGVCSTRVRLSSTQGYFKIHEREISHINSLLAEIENSPTLANLKKQLEREQHKAENQLNDYRKMMAEAKKSTREKARIGC